MDLIDKVVNALDVPPGLAESGLGAIFTALRMSLDPKVFDELGEVECRIHDWVGKTVIGGGRTGEMLALVGPLALARNLGAAGFANQQADQLIEVVFDSLDECLPSHVADEIRSKRPTLSVG